MAFGFFLGNRDGFIDVAHPTAAVTLFVLIFFNVVLNGFQRSLVRKQNGLPPGWLNRYMVLRRLR